MYVIKETVFYSIAFKLDLHSEMLNSELNEIINNVIFYLCHVFLFFWIVFRNVKAFSANTIYHASLKICDSV